MCVFDDFDEDFTKKKASSEIKLIIIHMYIRLSTTKSGRPHPGWRHASFGQDDSHLRHPLSLHFIPLLFFWAEIN